MKKLTILGIPLDLGTEKLGVDIGPNAFRYQQIKEKLKNIGFEIVDLGNIDCISRNKLEVGNPKMKYYHEVLRIAETSAKLIDQEIGKGRKIIALGGDHSISLGTVSGASAAVKGDLGLIYLDTHGDLNTDKTTLTGNIHGMHLASLLGFGNQGLIDVYRKEIKLAKKNLLHIGGNDFDASEIELIKKEHLQCFKMIDILSYGLAPLLNLIKKLQKRVRYIWASLDLDVIDSTYAPGTGMVNRGGMTYREIMAVSKYIGQNCNVIGIDIVEYNPLLDVQNMTAELGIELIASLFGSNYSWYTNYLYKNRLR